MMQGKSFAAKNLCQVAPEKQIDGVHAAIAGKPHKPYIAPAERTGFCRSHNKAFTGVCETCAFYEAEQSAYEQKRDLDTRKRLRLMDRSNVVERVNGIAAPLRPGNWFRAPDAVVDTKKKRIDSGALAHRLRSAYRAIEASAAND